VIALIDYKAGNLTSVKKALAAIGADVFVPNAPGDLAGAAGIIVPGVGHFGATRALDQPWIDAIRARVRDGRPLFGICLGMQWLFEGSEEAPDLPGLGLLSGRCYRLPTVRLKPDTTEDDGEVSPKPDTTEDDGEVSPKPDTTEDRTVPPKPGTTEDTSSGSVRLQADRDHGGVRLQPDRVVKIPHVGWNSLAIRRQGGLLDGVPTGAQVYFTHSYVAPDTADTSASTDHGDTFAAMVQRGHIGGVQFHPEKSGEVGLRILRNFVELTRAV
jgi:glutamine amidotransferase